MEQLALDLAAKFPIAGLVLSALGSIVIIAQVVVALTPSKADDEFLDSVQKGFFGSVIDVLKKFAPFQRK